MRLAKNVKRLSLVVLILFVSSMAVCAGIFLLKAHSGKPEGRTDLPGKKAAVPVRYSHMSREIGGANQEISLLEIDPSDSGVEIKPVLSHDSVFGFELLSSMLSRSKAFAGTNAGFFYEYGQPAGMVMIDGSMITGSTGKYPVFVSEGGKAALKQFATRLWMNYGTKSIELTGLNAFEGRAGDVVLYTDRYGTDNRVKADNISVVIKDGTIESISESSGETDIPDGGSVLTFFKPAAGINAGSFKKGEMVKFGYAPNLGENAQAYECGSWILKGGNIVVGERDEWVGVMTNRDPRTAIGIKGDGAVILVTVDGRQPSYSEGLTGKELGGLLLSLGAVDAAMLDGGASAEMIVKGKIVNRPSFKGRERLLGGAIAVMYREK